MVYASAKGVCKTNGNQQRSKAPASLFQKFHGSTPKKNKVHNQREYKPSVIKVSKVTTPVTRLLHTRSHLLEVQAVKQSFFRIACGGGVSSEGIAAAATSATIVHSHPVLASSQAVTVNSGFGFSRTYGHVIARKTHVAPAINSRLCQSQPLLDSHAVKNPPNTARKTFIYRTPNTVKTARSPATKKFKKKNSASLLTVPAVH